jgi:hypothetical protein
MSGHISDIKVFLHIPARGLTGEYSGKQIENQQGRKKKFSLQKIWLTLAGKAAIGFLRQIQGFLQ